LHHLDLSDSPIGDTGLKILLESEMADSLCDVSFPNKQITDRGIEILVDSGILGRMIGPRLNLMKNQIGDQGLACLAGCEHLARFRELVLRENLISDAGILALAQSPHVGHLEYLDFWRNRITDVGAFALANSPYLDKIVDLSLKENAITTVGRDALVTRFGERVKLSLD
jgi:hypothetical protein